METAVCSRFRTLLEAEERRMANEWFFKWHAIGRDIPVEIDSFDGRKISYSGTEFWGTPEVVFWDTIQRYLRQKVSELFDKLESEIRSYPTDIQKQSVMEVAALISGFVSRIRKLTIQKDRILRGNGMEFPARRDRGAWNHADIDEVRTRAQFLTRLIDAQTDLKPVELPSPATNSTRLNNWYRNHQAETWIAGTAIAVVGMVIAILAA